MPENEILSMRTGALIRFGLLLAALSTCAVVVAAGTDELKSHEQYKESDDIRNVLVLHSSHRGYGWTDSIMEGIELAMEAAPDSIELWVEYLDASRLHSDSFARQLSIFYQRKYEQLKFDVVITSDRKALEFLLDNREAIAPGVPVVFSTVSNLGGDLADRHPNVMGVSESGDFVSTLDLAFTLHPNIEHIVFISPGIRSRHLIEFMVADYRAELELSIWHYETLAEIEHALSLLPENAVLVPVGEPVTVGGAALPMNKLVAWMAERTDAPIYTVWDFALGYGIVGGYLVNGLTQGETVAEIALKILRGKAIEEIPTTRKSPSRYMFDYEQLRRFDVDEDLLPPDSVIINMPTTLYGEYKRAVWLALAIFAVLSTVILALGVNVERRKRAERSLRTNQQRFRDFAESAADWFWETDSDMRFTYISRRSQDVLGVTVDEILGSTMAEVFGDGENHDDAPDQPVSEESADRSFQMQSFWRRPDGVRRVISTSGKTHS